MRDVRCNYRDVTGPAVTFARVPFAGVTVAVQVESDQPMPMNWSALSLLRTTHGLGHVIRKGQTGG